MHGYLPCLLPFDTTETLLERQHCLSRLPYFSMRTIPCFRAIVQGLFLGGLSC